MSAHTPGPWEVPGANVFRVVAPEAPHENKGSGLAPPYPWAIVADTDPDSVGGPEAAANARLIAAAPKLLEALREIEDIWQDGSGPDGGTTEIARAAIAKATGGGE